MSKKESNKAWYERKKKKKYVRFVVIHLKQISIVKRFIVVHVVQVKEAGGHYYNKNNIGG